MTNTAVTTIEGPFVTTEPGGAEFPGCTHVRVTWKGADREDGVGWLIPNRYVARMVRAIEAGAVHETPEVLTDVNGNTYVHARSRVMAKYVNSDLKRLGF